jgi:methylaspartate mutase sigma subunit
MPEENSALPAPLRALPTGAAGSATATGRARAAAPWQRPALVPGGEPVSLAGPVTMPRPGLSPAGRGLSVVVTSVSSDSHTWNLVFLQLALEELGHEVLNLGACVPDDLVVAECLRVRPDLVVVSSVNGHGFHDGTRLIGRIRTCPELTTLPVVIGGKLGIAGPGGRRSRDQLQAAGFDAVFEEGAGLAVLRSYADQLTASSST